MRSLPIFSVLTLASVLVASCVQESEDDQDGSSDALLDVDSADDSSADASLAPDSPQCPWVGNIDMDDEAAVQAFVDSGCDTIIGDLTLVNSDREQLPVVPVRILEGALLVLGCPRLRSLDGLESLEAATSIALSKTDTYDQWGQWTPVGLNDLTDLTALSNVVSVGYSGVDFSDALGGLSIQYAPRLRKLDGLENVTTLGGLSLQSLPALQNLEALDNLERLFFYTIGDCACIGWNDIERLLSGFVLGAPSLASWTPSDDPCVDSDADGSATEP